MYKRLTRIIVGLFIVSILVIKMSTIVQGTQDGPKYTDKIAEEQGILALDYHYVRDKSLWNLMIEKLTNTPELMVYSVYEDDFEKQINALIDEKAYFATLEEVLSFRESGVYPDKCVWICFDDGDESVYEKAYPLLKANNIPFTMFIIAGQVGNKDFKNLRLCTWEQLREMRDSGLVSFGSHTYDLHYLEDDKAEFLAADMYEEFLKDIKMSKKILEEELEVEITSIAYPFGDTNDAITELVKEAGFSQAFILAPHLITSQSDPYYQDRFLVDNNLFYEVILPYLKK